jgi:hypothetical protein
MKKTILLFASLICSLGSFSQTICNAAGNLIIYTNYDGGTLNIDVNANIPNLKIGVVSYEGVTINVTGTYAINVTAIAYAGYNGNDLHCGSAINTSISAPLSPGSTNTITILPAATLSNPNGNPTIVCGHSCSTTTNQGGCNTVDQIEAYFLNKFPGSTLYAHMVQYGCWVSTQMISSGGTCCATTTGIGTNEERNTFSVFPNPADNTIEISKGKELSNAGVRLFDAMGALMYEETNINGSAFVIDLSSCSTGLYFVELNDKGTITRKPFVKK